jgi:hypothetical protein
MNFAATRALSLVSQWLGVRLGRDFDLPIVADAGKLFDGRLYESV